jgi:hypothetical protein
MAAIHDLIARVAHERLRGRLRALQNATVGTLAASSSSASCAQQAVRIGSCACRSTADRPSSSCC